MSFMNLKVLSNSIDFNVNSIYDVFVYFVDIASDCLIETRFVDCIDAYGLRDVLTDGVFYVSVRCVWVIGLIGACERGFCNV